MNKPVSGSNYRAMGAFSEELRVFAQKDPNMTVAVNEGSFYTDSMKIVEFEGGNTPAIKAPATGNEWVVICLNKKGTLVVLEGVPMAQPDLPEIPKSYLPLAAIYLTAMTNKITSDMVFDIRPFLASGAYPGDHAMLTNTNMPNCHPISAITNLQAALDDKVTYADLDKVALKMDNVKGTNTATFVLNQAQTGEPSSNVGIAVNRGDEVNVGIRYNEGLGAWEFTNDGSVWNQFISSVNLDGSLKDATASIKGVAKLSVEPKDAFNPIAVGDNDPRITSIALKANKDAVYSKSDVDTMLADKADVSNTYTRKSIDDMLDGKMDINKIYTEAQIDAKLLGKANVGDSYTKPETDLAMLKKADADAVYTKTDVDTMLTDKANVADVYTSAQVDTLLNDKANSADVYTRAQVDGQLLTKADTSDVYTQSEVDNALALKANAADVNTKKEVSDALLLKADKTNVYSIADADAKFATISDYYNKTDTDSALGLKANVSDVYQKTDVDTLLTGKANVVDVYTQTDVDTKLNSKADKSKVYTKTEIDTTLGDYEKSDAVVARLGKYAKVADVYTKASVNTLLNDKANSTDVANALNTKADKAQYYSASVIDSKLDGYVKQNDFDVLKSKVVQISDVYTKADIDAKLLDKGDKAQIINLLSTKVDDADMAAYVEKSDLTTQLSKYAPLTVVDSKIDASKVYDKTYIDSNVALNSSVDAKLVNYAKVTDVVTKSNLSSTLSTYAKASDVALKANQTDLTSAQNDINDLKTAQGSMAKASDLANYVKKTDSVNSVILTSSNGSKFRLVVSDTGELSTIKIS